MRIKEAAIIISGLALIAFANLGYAMSKEAQEYAALLEKQAPVKCEIKKLREELAAAEKTKDHEAAKKIGKRSVELGLALAADAPRMAQLLGIIAPTPDFKTLQEQERKLDAACK